MPDMYYDSPLTGEQLDEAFSKLGDLDKSVASAAQSAADAKYWAEQAASSSGFDSTQYYTKTETNGIVGWQYVAQYGLDNWTDSDNPGYPYTQTVQLTPEIDGAPTITTNSKFFAEIGSPKTGVAETDDILKAALSIIADGITTAGDGTLTTLTREKPSADIPVVWTLRTEA